MFNLNLIIMENVCLESCGVSNLEVHEIKKVNGGSPLFGFVIGFWIGVLIYDLIT